MIFRNFRINIIIRVLFLNLTILGIIWLMFRTNYYITTGSLILVAILQVILLIGYAERTNTMFIKFLNAIRYDDFSQTYTIKGLGRSFNDLNREFNKVMQKFQEIRAEKEAQYHYLKTIVQHIGIGLIVLDEKEEVQLINNSAKKLLNINDLTNLRQLSPDHSAFVAYIRQPKSNERELIKLRGIDQILHLAVRTTSVKLMNDTFRIISIQDIQSELEDKEMEAWQNLIRVLTHEIINSVTPIASLASTIDEDLSFHLHNLDEQAKNLAGEAHYIVPKGQFQESVEEVHYAIKTIQRRSEGLIRFVKDFRSLTKIPMPNLQNIVFKDLADSILFLLKEEFKKNQIQFDLQVKPLDLPLIADPQLLEQVLINLLKNASHAVETKTDKKISLRAQLDSTGKVQVEIEDNGSGISEEAMKNIFIPFYTTKKSGSGIGLSLSRQVMRLHGGSISVQSELGVGTIFTLRFA
ncbi:MAG: ATP-binding protein [Microscillaceae bacterium]|jgi:nitrogen fixation/metabolism regulation signal transduction histidine kinase|nr:ATP-binding protein [Microscillaceae bacterium]